MFEAHARMNAVTRARTSAIKISLKPAILRMDGQTHIIARTVKAESRGEIWQPVYGVIHESQSMTSDLQAKFGEVTVNL